MKNWEKIFRLIIVLIGTFAIISGILTDYQVSIGQVGLWMILCAVPGNCKNK